MTTGRPDYVLVFLALARNCAVTLPGALRGLQRLEEAGLRVHLVAGENGSEDNTRVLLEAAAQTGRVTVVDTSFMATAPERLHRMAIGREHLAGEAKNVAAAAIGVIDLDEPFLAQLDPAQLAKALTRLDEPDLFAVSATSRPTYYDLLAFEDETRSYSYLERRIKALERNPLRYYRLFRDVIYADQERLTSNADIRCISAFNGLALYKTETYVLGSYLPPTGAKWICEHVAFNRSLAGATGGRMLIDAELVLPTPPEHGRRSLPGFVRQRATKLARRVTAHFRR